jgi:superfamily I DNA and/or RNA helicase
MALINCKFNANSPKRDSNGEFPRPFLCCIIDDASLCTEPQTLIPLSLGVKNLILVGDLELLPFNLNSSVRLIKLYT